MPKCNICGKEFSDKGIGTHMWRMHGNGKSFNPNRGYLDGSRVAWNKGLTKENSEPLQRMAKSLTKPKEDWQIRVDDDGKLYQKFLNKRINAKKENIQFGLTFEEYCNLVFEARLLSSQLGFTGNNYVLARYKDRGGYIVGNCRFITQQENSDEKQSKLRGVGKFG